MVKRSYPFLAVGVLQVVDAARVPLHTDSQQAVIPEAILSHDDQVGEETGRGLDHTDLTIGHGDQPVKKQRHKHSSKPDSCMHEDDDYQKMKTNIAQSRTKI